MAYVTFIIPSISRDSLNKSIDSLIKQTDPDWEALIVFDATSPMFFDDPRIRLIVAKKSGAMTYNKQYNVMISHGGNVRNEGFKLVSSKWTAFLDDDDFVYPDYVQRLKEEDEDEYAFILFRMLGRNGIIPDISVDAITQNQCGISFAVKTDIIKQYNLKFENDGSEDWKFLDLMIVLELQYKISKYVVYETGNKNEKQLHNSLVEKERYEKELKEREEAQKPVKLSFYTPIAYDYKYAFASILSYYDIADEILLGIDCDRMSWSGFKYEFDQEFFDAKIKEIDKDNKIKIVEDNFHKYSVPIQNDTQERNYITNVCSTGNYIIGIDSDEILINAKEFREWFDATKPIADINAQLLTVYKAFGTKLLLTCPYESAVVGTKHKDSYRKCRHTDISDMNSNLQILHFSWGRKDDEIKQKLVNWGHSQDFDIVEVQKDWQQVNLDNYQELTFFHPLKLRQWWQKSELVDVEKYGFSEELLKEINKFGE